MAWAAIVKRVNALCGHPVAGVLAAACLFAVTQRYVSYASRSLVIPAFVREKVLRWPARPVMQRPLTLHVIRRDDLRYEGWDEAKSTDELMAVLHDHPERVVIVGWTRGEWGAGVWSPWVWHSSNSVTARDLSTNADMPKGRERDEARNAAIRLAIDQGRQDVAAGIGADGSYRSRFVWWGPLADAGSIVLLIVAGYSAWSVPSFVRGVRARGRLRRGRCPRCGYDLARGRSATRLARCPECGEQALDG